MNRQQAVSFLVNYPDKFGKMLGFNKLGILHRQWIRKMLTSTKDETLQASRGTYKTTCVSIALALIIILRPNKRTMFMRKTDGDIKEVIKQVQKILSNQHTLYFVQVIYGVNLKFLTQSNGEITTNLTTDIKGTSQLIGIGCSSSLTGKHFDYIFTDDIVNVSDRISKAAREATKIIYQELQNIKNRDGRIFNTGTPWHKEDCFSIMPEAEMFNCYHPEIAKIISQEELEHIKKSMSPSLFAANYELRHIAAEDILFDERPIGAGVENILNAPCHIDSAYGGGDYTAFTAMNYKDGHFYIYGRCWQKHVEDCYSDIVDIYNRFTLGKCWNETNADKGLVARDLKRKYGMRMVTYSEGMNKHIKISAYLKAIWQYVIFVEGTDDEYIEQILDYTEDAEHDDCPDSAASLARKLYKKAKNIHVDIGLNDDVKEESVE